MTCIALRSTEVLAKESGERVQFAFDFSRSARVPSGVTLSSIELIDFTPKTSSDPNDLTIVTSSVDATEALVKVTVEKGIPGMLYTLFARVVLSDGQKLYVEGLLEVC